MIINDYNFAILIISLLMRRILIQPHHRPCSLISHTLIILAHKKVIIRASTDETAIKWSSLPLILLLLLLLLPEENLVI